MKNLFFAFALISLISFSGCGDKVIKFYPTFEEEIEFTINNSGQFEESMYLLRQQIEDALADVEIPEDGAIESVDIESLSIEFDAQTGNEANFITFQGSISGLNSVGFTDLVQQVTLPVNNTKLTLTALANAGVAEMTEQLRGVIENDLTLPANFTGIELKVSGNSAPTAGQAINVKGKFYVKVSMVYSQDVSLGN